MNDDMYVDPEFDQLFEEPQVRYGDVPLGGDPETSDPGGLLRELQRAMDGQPDLPNNPLVREAEFRDAYERMYFTTPEESKEVWETTTSPLVKKDRASFEKLLLAPLTRFLDGISDPVKKEEAVKLFGMAK